MEAYIRHIVIIGVGLLSLIFLNNAARANSAYGYFHCEVSKGSVLTQVMNRVAQFEYDFAAESTDGDIKKLMSQMNAEERAFEKQVTARWSRTFTSAVREQFGGACELFPPFLAGPFETAASATDFQRDTILEGVESRENGTNKLHYQVIDVQFN